MIGAMFLLHRLVEWAKKRKLVDNVNEISTLMDSSVDCMAKYSDSMVVFSDCAKLKFPYNDNNNNYTFSKDTSVHNFSLHKPGKIFNPKSLPKN